MRTLLYVFLIGISLSLVNCGQKQCINPKNKVLGKSTELIVGYAKNKSFWVYSKENSSLRDSIYEDNFQQKIEHLRDGEICDDKEVVYYKLIGQGILCNTAEVKIEARNTIDVATYEDNIGNSLFNFILYKEKNDEYANNNWIDFEILPTFTVLSKEYENVVKVFQKGFDVNGVEGSSQKQNRYFAPKIGLIRLENIPDAKFPDDGIYNLEKYEIK